MDYLRRGSAPLSERVWAALTQPRGLAAWFGTAATVDLRPGEPFDPLPDLGELGLGLGHAGVIHGQFGLGPDRAVELGTVVLRALERLEERTVPALLGQQLFPADNPWNQQITTAPVAANTLLFAGSTRVAPVNDIAANTQMFTKVIEDYVRKYPDQWLWVHRRWKTRPEGQPPLY